MNTQNRPWTATSTKWKEASRAPHKAVVLGGFAALIAITSTFTLNAQALPVTPAAAIQASADVPAAAPTIRPLKVSVKERVSMLFDLVRQTNRRTI